MNIQKTTEHYITIRPPIKHALEQDLINYSKLARRIGNEVGEKHFDAILIAIRRYGEKIRKKESRSAIAKLLSKSRLFVRNTIAVAIVENTLRPDLLMEIQEELHTHKERIHIVHGHNGITLIFPQQHTSFVKKKIRAKLISLQEHLVEIILQLPKNVEEVPGVMAHLYGLFAEENINVIETVSCWTDTFFIMHEKDLSRSLELLKF